VRFWGGLRSQFTTTAVCFYVIFDTPDTPGKPDVADVADVPSPATAPASAQASESDTQHGEPRVALPQPLINIWESFVLDQAQRGRIEVHLMVPILISMLSERGVVSLRPDENRRRRLERWRDVLKLELSKIGQAKPQSNNSLQDGFRALNVERSMPLDALGADTTNQVVYGTVLMFLQSELAEHKRAVTAQVGRTATALQELNRQEEVMVRHRLQLMQRLSGYSDELLELGHAIVRKYQALELERIAVGSDAEADVDAALASLMPPPILVTYRTVFYTLWQVIERAIRPLMVLEPPAVGAWRRRVFRHLVAALKQRSHP
jgi:hypothetical protein